MKILPSAAQALIDKGVPFIEAKWVSAGIETIQAKQKGTETKKEMKILRHLFHRGSRAYLLDEWLPEGFKDENLKITAKEGQTYVIELHKFERDGAGYSCGGIMTLVAEPDKK